MAAGEAIKPDIVDSKPLSDADLAYLKPYLVDYVAAGVRAGLSGASEELLATLQINQIDILSAAYPSLTSVYSPQQLIEAGNHWTDDYISGIIFTPPT